MKKDMIIGRWIPVTTDAVVWIEMDIMYISLRKMQVTTDAVVWIEIFTWEDIDLETGVTTDAVVWIEIYKETLDNFSGTSPLIQWCGLKSSYSGTIPRSVLSPLMQWCGLKYHGRTARGGYSGSPLMQWCGLKSLAWYEAPGLDRHH